MVLSDKTLRKYGDSLVSPFIGSKIRKNVASYGCSQSGYDIRLAHEFRMITEKSKHAYWTEFGKEPILDPKMGSEELEVLFEIFYGNSFVIPPHGFVLAHSVEYVSIPNDVLVIVLGKSTYARLSLVCNVTPIEPGFLGHITLELSNTSDLPLRVYANEGIAQFIFMRIDQEVGEPYNGKYQDQSAQVVHSRIET